MTAETATVSLGAIDATIAAATPRLSEDEQRLAAALLRLLSAGAPVTIAAAAAAAGLPRARAEPVLQSWPAVFWDGRGRVTGM
jgi:Helix-turn-helix domain of alkylmercury lyase